MKKYVAARKDVCAGRLLQYGGLPCRGMLFNVDENGLANDLIYTTPTKYPICGINPKISIDGEFSISHYVELEELLKYLNYGVDLTQGDLNQIFRKLITHDRWLTDHMGLFGYKKLDDNMNLLECEMRHFMTTGEFVGTCRTDEAATISSCIFDNLRKIELFENGNPYPKEPGYSFIKKR